MQYARTHTAPTANLYEQRDTQSHTAKLHSIPPTQAHRIRSLFNVLFGHQHSRTHGDCMRCVLVAFICFQYIRSTFFLLRSPQMSTRVSIPLALTIQCVCVCALLLLAFDVFMNAMAIVMGCCCLCVVARESVDSRGESHTQAHRNEYGYCASTSV